MYINNSSNNSFQKGVNEQQEWRGERGPKFVTRETPKID